MNEPASLYIMALIYILAGIMHFIKPKMYLRIMPPYMPWHKELVFASGIAEVLLGVGLCIPFLKDLSIYGIILMLLVFLTVHFYMLNEPKASGGLPKWLLILRIPLQFGLIYWAWIYL